MSLLESFISLTSVSSKTTLSRPSTATSWNTKLSRRSSTSSYNTLFKSGANFEDVPTLVRTPWELERFRRSNVSRNKPPTPRSLPAHIFQNLPEEIYLCILQQLECSYFDDWAGTCTSCYVKDLHNLAFTSRAWEKSARRQLYTKIWISSLDPTSVKQSRRLPYHRIKLLRRTLRDASHIGRLVKELRFPDAQEIYQTASTNERQKIINNLASLVMSCPSLERFTGLYLTYDHGYDRLTNAISTRPCLKEKVWVLKADDVGWDENGIYRAKSRFHDPLWKFDNTDAFLHAHDNWACLDTLCLFGQGNCSMMDFRSFIATFRNLPSLKHLVISDFEIDQFNDRTLQAIPAMRSLRLQDLPGLTEKGLMRFANSEAAKSIRRLSLIGLEIASAAVISRYFANLSKLRRFVLAQEACPCLAPGLDIPSILYASDSLEYLHWDVLAYGPAYHDLASSISAGGMPSLRTIRAPSDDDGFLQALCRPRDQITLPIDAHLINQIEDPFSLSLLSTARREAQKRLEEAKQIPLMRIVVDEGGVIQHTYTLWDYMGTLGSKIIYSLEPDAEGSEEPIAGLNDLLLRKEVQGSSKICSGGGSVTNDRRERDRTKKQHVQRRMVKAPGLEVFF
ncbi:hypothetical protein EJ08DRAFT_587787 [Tothia fuscella]|uniref:F-box domain-containing protein n=1 Tax=Tothia fuscella TaxID=1048955 RepID=A0A9P4NTU1_9PEZI|nr:hypothetical protein EJ08DRAFT_587787 [Tothia fuscella]